MEENQTTKKPSGPSWVRLVSDIAPAIAFFIAFSFANKTHQPNPIIFATAIFLPVAILGFAFSWIKEKKISPVGIFTFVMIAIFSGLALKFNNGVFVKMKSTFIFSIMGSILLVSTFTGHNILKTLFDGALHMAEKHWRDLTIRVGIFYLFLAGLNELMWRNMAEKDWVFYHVWGDMILNFVFWAINIALLTKHLTDENGNPLLEEGKKETL